MIRKPPMRLSPRRIASRFVCVMSCRSCLMQLGEVPLKRLQKGNQVSQLLLGEGRAELMLPDFKGFT